MDNHQSRIIDSFRGIFRPFMYQIVALNDPPVDGSKRRRDFPFLL